MNPETRAHEPATGKKAPDGSSSPRGLVNPNLTGSLEADHAALENDLLQAQDLAADFQRQLAGKSNEYAQLKQILEKTQNDLSHLQEGIVELRGERHRLANEALRATAFQAKLTKVTVERDRMRIELEVVRQALVAQGEESTSQLRERDRRIAELVVEMVGLRRDLGTMREALGQSGARFGAAISSPATRPAPVLDPMDEAEPEIEIERTHR